MDERFSRSARIFGIENQEKLNSAKVLVFGLGGVGGAVCEALARSGVGTIGLVDKDTVDITNINRQLIATESTVGMKKTDACEKRLKEINPGIKLNKYDLFYLPETADKINLSEYDYIVDAIDNVTAKLELIVRAKNENIRIISSMARAASFSSPAAVGTSTAKSCSLRMNFCVTTKKISRMNTTSSIGVSWKPRGSGTFAFNFMAWH
jgi:tRNA A37 threonylcarbamoyladenosine dehydratase